MYPRAHFENLHDGTRLEHRSRRVSQRAVQPGIPLSRLRPRNLPDRDLIRRVQSCVRKQFVHGAEPGDITDLRQPGDHRLRPHAGNALVVRPQLAPGGPSHPRRSARSNTDCPQPPLQIMARAGRLRTMPGNTLSCHQSSTDRPGRRGPPCNLHGELCSHPLAAPGWFPQVPDNKRGCVHLIPSGTALAF